MQIQHIKGIRAGVDIVDGKLAAPLAVKEGQTALVKVPGQDAGLGCGGWPQWQEKALFFLTKTETLI